MKTESLLFNGFIENRGSELFALLIEHFGFSANPVELFVDALAGTGVTAIYKVANLFIIGNIVDLHVDTPQGKFGMRITENEVEQLFEIRITNMQDYSVIETFTLSKVEPSGLPDGES